MKTTVKFVADFSSNTMSTKYNEWHPYSAEKKRTVMLKLCIKGKYYLNMDTGDIFTMFKAEKIHPQKISK